VTTSLSRRAFVIVMGAAAASVSTLWTRERRAWTRRLAPADAAERCCDYVDHEGWILTTMDAQQLTKWRHGDDRDTPTAAIDPRIVRRPATRLFKNTTTRRPAGNFRAA
jgi:hypothetical protein